MPNFSQFVLTTTAAMFLAGPIAVNAHAGQHEKTTGVITPTPVVDKDAPEENLAEAKATAKKLLLIMDTDNDGTVSQAEWMKFMDAEFDRLDTDHDGRLDLKELTQSRMRYRPAVGK